MEVAESGWRATGTKRRQLVALWPDESPPPATPFFSHHLFRENTDDPI